MLKVIAKVGDDISTDVIYPGRFMATVLPTETPQFAFADAPELNALLKSGAGKGAAIVAGKNFGCGSSREQAASCLRGHELTIVARGFARIFLQNAINLGLSLVTAPELEADEGDELVLESGSILNQTTGKRSPPCRFPARQAIIDAGGLIRTPVSACWPAASRYPARGGRARALRGAGTGYPPRRRPASEPQGAPAKLAHRPEQLAVRPSRPPPPHRHGSRARDPSPPPRQTTVGGSRGIGCGSAAVSIPAR